MVWVSFVININISSVRQDVLLGMVDVVMGVTWVVNTTFFIYRLLLGFMLFVSRMFNIINTDLLSIRQSVLSRKRKFVKWMAGIFLSNFLPIW